VSAEDVAFLRQLYDRWEQGDFSTVDAFAADVEFARIGQAIVPGQGGPGSWQGREEMWRAILEWLRNWDDFHVRADEFIELEDGRVLVLSHQRALGKVSGIPVEKDLGEVFVLRDGKIVSWEAYWEREDAMQAVGIAAPTEPPSHPTRH
jgi:ketosteroid isomerase-like protein